MATRRQFVQVAAGAGIVSAAGAPPRDAAERSSTATALKTDVLVCGGGCAGVAAALSAARSGAQVLLVEKAPFAGGIITSVGLPYFDGIADIRDNRIVVRGVALELLSKSGVCRPDAKRIERHNPTIPNTFEFKLLLDSLLQREKTLQNLFNSFVCV
jgi:NADPH-dependent 2,4-dienoyl-CoA reductase/sulfur reductase-like enzyme